MTLRSLEEDFRDMGLSERAIQRSMVGMHSLNEDQELDLDGDFEDEDEDVLSIVEGYKRKRKLRGKKRIAARRYRKSAAGKKSARKQAMRRKRPSAKKKAAKRRRRLARLGAAKKGFIRTLGSSSEYDGDGDSLHESLLANMQILAEATEHQPAERFDQYVEAFNNVADLCELLTLRYHEAGEEEMAEDIAGLALAAELTLDEMEDLDGVLTVEQDEALEEALAEAMELVGEELEDYAVLEEELDEEWDDDDELDEDEEFDEDEDDDDDDDDDLLERAKLRFSKGEKKAISRKVKAHEKEQRRKSKAKKRAVKKTRKMSKSGKSYKASEVDTMAGLRSRGDVRDPEAVGGWISHYGSYRR